MLVDWGGYGAVPFDLDGVITPIADVHEHAWAVLFADFDFTKADYLAYVDGRPLYRASRTATPGRDLEWCRQCDGVVNVSGGGVLRVGNDSPTE